MAWRAGHMHYDGAMSHDAWLSDVLQKVADGLLSAESAEDLIAARGKSGAMRIFTFSARAELDVDGEVEAPDEATAALIVASGSGIGLLRQVGSPRVDPDSIKVTLISEAPKRRTKRG